MKVHHLNCGTMREPTAPIVSHVLLIETSNGLILVDSGYGLDDIADPARRLGPLRHLLRPALNPAETAARQVERLGFRRDDVRHIILTHLDLDHAGGLSDFPKPRSTSPRPKLRGQCGPRPCGRGCATARRNGRITRRSSNALRPGQMARVRRL